MCKNQFYEYLSYDNYKNDFPDDYDKYYKGRTSGTVCGLDPHYCPLDQQKWDNQQGQPQRVPRINDEKNCTEQLKMECGNDTTCREKQIACSLQKLSLYE